MIRSFATSNGDPVGAHISEREDGKPVVRHDGEFIIVDGLAAGRRLKLSEATQLAYDLWFAAGSATEVRWANTRTGVKYGPDGERITDEGQV